MSELEKRVEKLETTLARLIEWLDWHLHIEHGNEAHLIFDVEEDEPIEYLGEKEE